jgi:hypothetical protein
MTLEGLARRELAILEAAHRLKGTIEAKVVRLREMGTFAESASIHKGYLDLGAPPRSSLEALKRAVFLAWYEVSEPGCVTGVGDLDDAQVRRTHELLHAAYAAGQLDAEFRAMLGWYWSIADYHFRASSPGLSDYLSSLDPQAYQSLGFSRSGLEGRGQMGVYWVSIACRAA